MLDSDESFVLWIDRKRSQPGRLVGRAERTRSSERVEFGSTGELVRFLERSAWTDRSASLQGAPNEKEDER